MSRTIWIAVGAVGGIYAYRRGQRAVDEARERGLVGNAQYAASTAASVAQGASRLFALAAQPSPADLDDYRRWELERERSVQVTPVRRTPVGRDHRIPATALKMDALNPSAIMDSHRVPATAGR